MGDEDKAVLASRVLSYLKRRAGNGKKPSDAESKAAATALQLLSISFPQLNSDQGKFFDKLIEISRKSGEASAFAGHDPEQASIMQYQQAVSKLNRMFEMYSKIMQMNHDTKKAIVGNLR